MTLDEEDDIVCTLENVSLIEPRPYFALSYCWGDPRVTERIRLGEGTAIVTTSLARGHSSCTEVTALHGQICKVCKIMGGRCVYQSKRRSRAKPIDKKNILQIYSRAKEVFSWVGSLHPRILSSGAHLALDSLSDWATDFDVARDPLVREAATALFGEQYWRRVWVIQEITVASKVTILYGDHRFRWNDVAAVLREVQRTQIDSKKSAFTSAGHGAMHLLQFRDQYTGRKSISLLNAMVWSRSALASDPRDKTFALLGLCYDGSLFVPVPNYKQSLRTIIADMSRAIMSVHKSLDLVCIKGVGDPNPMKDLPSWTPNWPSVWSGNLTIQEEQMAY